MNARRTTPQTSKARSDFMRALNARMKSDPARMSESRRKAAATREMKRKSALERLIQLERIVADGGPLTPP